MVEDREVKYRLQLKRLALYACGYFRYLVSSFSKTMATT